MSNSNYNAVNVKKARFRSRFFLLSYFFSYPAIFIISSIFFLNLICMHTILNVLCVVVAVNLIKVITEKLK